MKNRDHLREISRAILANDPQLAEVAVNLSQDQELNTTVESVRARMTEPALFHEEGIDPAPAIDPEFALETIVLRVGRPVLLVQNGTYKITDSRLEQPDAAIWRNRLFEPAVKERFDSIIPSIGRIDLVSHPHYDWVGTGWVVAEDIIATNRHVAKVFAEKNGDDTFIFRSFMGNGTVSAGVDFLQEHGNGGKHVLSVADVLYIAPDNEPDIAFLKIQRTGANGSTVVRLADRLRLSTTEPENKRFVAAIGYPAYDSRVPDADLIEKFFGDVFDKKRFSPGQITGVGDGEIKHDCSTLGGMSGAPVLDLASGEVLGLHFAGVFLQANHAVSSRVVASVLEKLPRGIAVAPGGLPPVANNMDGAAPAPDRVVTSPDRPVIPAAPAPSVQAPANVTTSATAGGIRVNADGTIVIPLQIHIKLDTAGPATAAGLSVSAEQPVPPAADPAGPSYDELLFTQRQAEAPVITHEKFMAIVQDPEFTEQDLAPYFIKEESRPDRLDPVFRIDSNKVRAETPQAVVEESAMGLNFANYMAKQKRQQRYAKQIRQDPSRIRIVAEGDSWFQYPVMLYDVIDHLMDRPELAIFCCSEAGDVIEKMLPKGEFYAPIQRENARIFLFSGGGNDLVDNGGLRRFLRNLPAGSAAKDHFIPAYDRFMENIALQYETLFTRVLRHQPGIHIICHGYSDAIPRPLEGKWLGKPMTSIGITDAGTQAAIVRIILRDLNDILARTSAKFPGSATYVDLRGIVPQNGWHDEFHPTSDYYGKVAAPIYREILKHA